jgi:protein SCO1/2
MPRGGVALLAALILALAVGSANSAGLKSGVFTPPRSAPDFSLRGSDGSEVNLGRYRGRVIALGFGYTFCPDVCPTTLADLAQARKRLGAAGQELQVVYVTVDPERDHAERLRRYLAAFDATFIGATGTPEQLADVRKAYGILAAKKPLEGSQSGYVVGHSAVVYLIDREGRQRALIPFGQSVDDIVHDVEALLRS